MLKSIILAAGEGSRMKSKLPKALHKVCDKPMLTHIIDAAKTAGVEENIVIIGHGKEKIMDTVNRGDIKYAVQPMGEDQPYGTGFAVMQAMDYIDDDDDVIILCGDTPLITGDTINDLFTYHKEKKYFATVLTSMVEDATGYGRIVRDDNNDVIKIVEHKDANHKERQINEINSGIVVFNGEVLKGVLHKLSNDNSQNEYYITDAIEILSKEGNRVGGYGLKDNKEILGVNSRVNLSEAEKIMRNRINEKLMREGVSIINPNNSYISTDAKIGKDTIIYPGVIIKGNVIIGEDCIIGHNSRIENSILGNNVEIQSSTIIDSKVDDNTKIGPYAYIRPNSEIGKNVKIGDFVEVKKSKIGDNSKASHLAYIGDAIVGKNVNIGCGVVFVNYDGENKHKTIVEDDSFIGSNSNLVAPVKVNKNGFVAAGSTITDEVPKNSLSIARARQVNKEGWNKK
ncbi:bifunctional UDP-N-acetylglucosamine diphosphorylase/glucosamine-1-phosphate N-acetyltransferase GlmU [Dethiothermospora halolimnae]|uniref:bifunctional UDP-N-acetylglucosamine diphosphorylase/glucosamine-1-phosphate N-acetyltransferase GlmU n=1 Tax=Dethiothermospora halolimnae TaxID=3114390 RepID=UPI003CCBD4C7